MEYSVVIPVYNSVDSLDRLCERLFKVFEKTQCKFEIILIDDFSKDKSWEKLKEIKRKNQIIIKIIRLSQNYGQHNATFCGLKYSSGNYVLTMDDDLQNDPEDFFKLHNKLINNNYDVVYGVGQSGHSTIRKVGSQVYKSGTKFFENTQGEGSSYRLINREIVLNIIEHKQHFIFIDELIQWYTTNIGFVSIKHSKRVYGKSGYDVFKILKLLTETTYSYGTWPLKLMTRVGAFFAMISFGVGVYFIIKKIFFDIGIAGFTAIIVAISFSTSMILLCFGILGSYLSNIYKILNDKPSYSIMEKEL